VSVNKRIELVPEHHLLWIRNFGIVHRWNGVAVMDGQTVGDAFVREVLWMAESLRKLKCTEMQKK
jgi:hypothetical protein